ncbi:MAG: hypothetical protein R3E14_14200 [Erythrobacter sp.]
MSLRTTLLLDAASAAFFILLCLGFREQVAAMTGLPESVVAVAGWICVPSAALFLWQATSPSRALLTMVVAGNAAWVLASVGVWLAFFGQLTPVGHALVIAQAIAVEYFAWMEWRGLKLLGRAPSAA